MRRLLVAVPVICSVALGQELVSGSLTTALVLALTVAVVWQMALDELEVALQPVRQQPAHQADNPALPDPAVAGHGIANLEGPKIRWVPPSTEAGAKTPQAQTRQFHGYGTRRWLSSAKPAYAADQDRLGPFSVAAANAIGAPHSQRGEPCQDSYSVYLSTEPLPAFVGVIADGISNSPASERASHLCSVRAMWLIRSNLDRLVGCNPEEWDLFAGELLTDVTGILHHAKYENDLEALLGDADTSASVNVPATTLTAVVGTNATGSGGPCDLRWLAVGNSPLAIVSPDNQQFSWLHTDRIAGTATPSIPHATTVTASGVTQILPGSSVLLMTDGMSGLFRSRGVYQQLLTCASGAAEGRNVSADLIALVDQRQQGQNDDRALVVVSWNGSLQ